MSRYLLFLVVGAVTLGDGYLYGLWTDRWHESEELKAGVARLDRIPMTVGDWHGTAHEIDPKVVERAEFAGYVLRSYENRRTGAVVNVMVACARPGPLSVHTPEICYRGAGYQMVPGSEAVRQTVEPGLGHPSGEFLKATFVRDDPTSPERLRVVWAWNYKGAWAVSDHPRWKFASQRALYKMYVSQEFMPRNEESDGAACVEFLRDFLPELDKALAADR
jgi:hypothetical protein